MITIDKLLIELSDRDIYKIAPGMPNRDKRILSSLNRQLSSGNFLTENQAKLLVKILKENTLEINAEGISIAGLLENPTWTTSFRKIEQVRTISIVKDPEPVILVEFTYNKRLKELIAELSKVLGTSIYSKSSKAYTIALTEKNLYEVVKRFSAYNFEISEEVKNFYKEISDILKSNEDRIDIFSTTNEKFLSLVKEKVGEISETNLVNLYDKRIRYQYTVSKKLTINTLTEKIASRSKNKIYLNNKTHSLTDLMKSLRELNRFPLLVVFNSFEPCHAYTTLEELKKGLDSVDITDKIGIYFRFENEKDGSNFNTAIANYKYNSKLDDSTLVVGVSNNKLPKFMFKTDWYPETVISFTPNFKANKTSLFCSAVDLVVFYGDKEPLGGSVDAIV